MRPVLEIIAKAIKTAVKKDQPGSSGVHVSVPLGSEKDKVQKDINLEPPVNNLDVEMAHAAIDSDDEDTQNGFEKTQKGVGPRRIAKVAIQHGDKVLMGKRRDNGKWTFPGGHLEPDEDYLQGALREVQEETGLELAPEHLEELAEVFEKEDKDGNPLHVQPFQAILKEKPATSMKMDPDAEVHRWRWVDISKGLPTEIAENLHVPPEHDILVQELGLVDLEGDEDDQTIGNHLRLDLGSGQAREPGHVGIDTFPYDEGTMVHDLTLGIPFPDNCAASVRMVNSLHEMDGLSEDPKALLAEILRVLSPGGDFYYEGPNALCDYPDGLEEAEHIEGVAKSDSTAAWHQQTFTSNAVPDPATADDAEPRTGVHQYDMLPADAFLAMDAVGYSWSDSVTSSRGNRAHGYPSQGALVEKAKTLFAKAATTGSEVGEYASRYVKIAKINKVKQVVYCVVLSPEESDLDEDFMLAEDIEQAAHRYLLNSRVIGSNHTKVIKGAAPVESYCAPMDMLLDGGPYGPQKVKKGAWVIGIKIFDPKEWAKVEDGEYQGVSVSGLGLRDDMT